MHAKHILLVYLWCYATAEPKTRLKVCVNNKDVSDEGPPEGIVYYNIGDNIDFSCKCLKTNKSKYFMVHKRDGSNNIVSHSSCRFNYIIKAEDIDNNTNVYCEVETKDKKFITSNFKTLILNSGVLITLPQEVHYNEEHPVNYNNICNDSGNIKQTLKIDNTLYTVANNVGKQLTPSDSGLVSLCEVIEVTWMGKTSQQRKINTRSIYNKIKYVYTPIVSTGITTEVACGVVVLICFLLVALYILFRIIKKKNIPSEDTRPPNQDIENACPNQLIYAELELSERPNNSIQGGNECQYAQIGGFLTRK